MDKRVSWFGIDFGTTNSAAYSFTGTDISNAREISYGDDEGRPMPSLVAIHKETGEVLTGRQVKDERNKLGEDYVVFSSIKTVLDSDIIWEIAGTEWTPEAIVAEIFKALKERVERDGENFMDEAVVSVPIGFSPKKKDILRRAANEAGINIKMFVSEPTAAFCSNYSTLKSNKNIAVFDWGGGTLDVVILRVTNGELFELAAESMCIAGDNIDEKLAEKIHQRFMRNKPNAVSFEELTASTRDKLIAKCEAAKCNFSDSDIESISINKYDIFGAVNESVDYNFFSLFLEKEVEEAIHCLEVAIKKANLNKASLDKILCVGGSSNLRPLQEKLAAIYGNDMIYYPEKVMWDIAKGTALISTRPGSFLLSKPIGLLLSDDTFLSLAEVNQTIPCSEKNLTFGVTDTVCGKVVSAKFIFTDSANDSERTFIDNFIFPLRGFHDEIIHISFYVDPDFNFKAKIGTNRMHESCYKVWTYSTLKVRYKIEG